MTDVLLVLNVVLDVFLARSPWLADSAAVVQAGFDGRVKVHLSAASLRQLAAGPKHIGPKLWRDEGPELVL